MNVRLILALRATAERLRTGSGYQWGHFGSCNCGHLAQTLTKHSAAQIHAAATERAADWGDAAIDYCPSSGFPIDSIIGEMLDAGLTLSDIRHLEDLSDRRVLCRLPNPTSVRRNERLDIVAYLDAWADLLAEEESFALAAE